jgi:hypothetical protein
MKISSSAAPRIRSRQIADGDMRAVADLLSRGFRRHKPYYWLRAFERLAAHPTPVGMPKYGYLLESNGIPIGAILLVSSIIHERDTESIRCNLSSWYVEPSYRSHAVLLFSQALKHRNATYLNVSAAAHVIPIVKAFGFTQYSSGQFVALAALSAAQRHGLVRITRRLPPDASVEAFELDLLNAHAQYGCICLWCTTSGGAHPFVFLPRVVRGFIPCAQLIYCRDVLDFVRFARPIGRFLALRGRPLVLIDANGPIPGLSGKYFHGVAPKYFKGPAQPRLGDLSFTEAALFGM